MPTSGELTLAGGRVLGCAGRGFSGPSHGFSISISQWQSTQSSAPPHMVAHALPASTSPHHTPSTSPPAPPTRINVHFHILSHLCTHSAVSDAIQAAISGGLAAAVTTTVFSGLNVKPNGKRAATSKEKDTLIASPHCKHLDS
jgi:hypothetical protein